MITFVFMVLLQERVATSGELWDGIAQVEHTLYRAVDGLKSDVMVFSSDPVRGYAIEGKGIFFVVPVRHKVPDASVLEAEFPGQTMRKSQTSKEDLNRSVQQWMQALSKKRALEEANLERVVQQVRGTVPQIRTQLGGLPDDLPLILIIEEREPAWVYASFGSLNRPKRHVVTLEVAPDLAEQIMSGSRDWSTRVPREDVERMAAPMAGVPQ